MLVPRKNHLRDRIACRVANFALNRIATPWYRDMIGGSVAYGLNSAARDSREGRLAPPSWYLNADVSNDQFGV